MKILYVTTIGMTMGFFKSIIKELIDNGNVVDIATNDTVSKVPECFKEWGCNIYTISTSRSPFSIGNIKAIKEIKKLAVNYDIVHCHTPLAGMATRLACKKLRKKNKLKVLYTAHGFHFYTGAPKKNWLIYYPIEKICSKWTDALITINQEDYNLAKEKFKSKNTYYVHGVGIDAEKYIKATGNKNAFCDELGISRESKIVISVGELNTNKNHQLVIQALQRISNQDLHYVIAGIGDQKDHLIELAEEKGVNLHLLGYRNDVPALYKSSDICVFPSIREGLGLAAVEGIAAGLPVVCSDNRGTRELKKLNVVFFENNDIESCCNALSKVLLMRPLKADKNDLYEFDISSINKNMMNIYLNVSKDE